MELPDDLSIWTTDTVIDLVKEHEFEPGIFDYKSVLNATRTENEKHNDNIRKTVCSMANTAGGFILFGILDRKEQVKSFEDRLVGIPDGDLPKEFGNKIEKLRPEVYFKTVSHILPLYNKNGLGVFVVYIPKSQRGPHMLLTTGAYYRRGEGGSAIIMDHYEVRDQMMYTEERLRKVTLFRLEIGIYRQTIAEIKSQLVNPNIMSYLYTLYHIDTSSYKTLLGDISSLLPPSTTLLNDLFQIATLIDKINNLLNGINELYRRYGFMAGPTTKFVKLFGGPSIESSIVYFIDMLNILNEKCTQCESQLEKIFGSLVEQDIQIDNE